MKFLLSGHSLWLGFLALVMLSSCEEGPGGTGGITGLVMAREYDLYGNIFAEYPAGEQRVFLVFGQDSVIGEETRTHFSGRYQFDFLRKGHYSIYAYSYCSTCPGLQEVSLSEVEINKSGELVQAPVIYIRAQ